MATKKQTEQKSSDVKVRVLVDCHLGKCNDVVSIEATELQSLAGVVDASPEAVAYAESLGK